MQILGDIAVKGTGGGGTGGKVSATTSASATSSTGNGGHGGMGSSTSTSSGTGGSSSTSSGTGGSSSSSSGACLSMGDEAALQASACTLVEDSANCYAANLNAPGTSTCLQQKDNLSPGCADCLAQEFTCGAGACFSTCANDPLGAACGACIVAKCGSAFETCSGLAQTDAGVGGLTQPDAGDAGFASGCACNPPGKLFPPNPSGLYCPFGSSQYCAPGTHCCEAEFAATTCQANATACPMGTTADWQCRDPVADCTNPTKPVCCAMNASLLVVGPGCRNIGPGLTQTTCVASGQCSPGIVMCTNDAECAAGQVCLTFGSHGGSVGGCGNCPFGLTACNAVCVDLTADDKNCGACGTACAAPTHCSNKVCM